MSNPDAYTQDGIAVFASEYSQKDWDTLKRISPEQPLAFQMGCCKARAVLKTSINGVQFFAHYSDECATGPERMWHIQGKDLVIGALSLNGIQGKVELSGGGNKNKWKADVYFEIGTRKVAIELQRSYQSLRDFIKRQKRYNDQGIECYWLARTEVANTLRKAISKQRIKNEFSGKFPDSGFWAELPHFYFTALRPEDETVGPPIHPIALMDWVSAIINKKLIFTGDKWEIVS